MKFVNKLTCVCSAYQSTSTFPCVDASAFHTPSEDINSWCQTLPTGCPISPSQQGSSSPELSIAGSAESQDTLSQTSDPLGTMLGPSSVSDECFSLPAESHDSLVQDQFLNLPDDNQTQAGSVPPMDFSGSSMRHGSLSGISRPSPTLNATQVAFQGPSFPALHDMPGFATIPQDMSGHVGPMSNLSAYSGHSHLPGCPSARHGPHHHNAIHFQQALSQQTGQQMAYNLSNQGWAVPDFSGCPGHNAPQHPNTILPNGSNFSHATIQPAEADHGDTPKAHSNVTFDQGSHIPSQASSVRHTFQSPPSPAHTEFSQADTQVSYVFGRSAIDPANS